MPYRLSSLDSLPNEILHDTFLYLTVSQNTPKRSWAVYALSKVNKRLRCLSLPMLFRDISVSSPRRYRSVVSYFSAHGKQNALYVQ